MSERIRTLILGGGMSGLSCAYHLKNNHLLVERSGDPGGLSRSIKQDGFVFDHTGHLLHLRHPYTLKLIPELLGDNLVLNERRAWIWSHNTYTRYPYQANLYGLPKNVIKDCLTGLIEAHLKEPLLPSREKVGMRDGLTRKHHPSPSSSPFPPLRPGGPAGASVAGKGEEFSPESFKNWVLRTFGKGFAKHFFFTYNEKLWTVRAEVLTAEWVAPFVPKPSIQEVINGAFTDQTKKYGYNATFYYPREGGIQALAFAFARHLHAIRLNTEVTGIDLAKKEVTLAGGKTVAYEFLVTTLPLVRFLQMAKPLPPEIDAARQTLRWSSVYNINLGVRRAGLSEKHWIYFPETKYRLYRVGFPMNFSTAMTPPGCSSMYVEIAHPPGQPPDEADAMDRTLRELKDVGLLKPHDEIVSRVILRIPVAYVTYDQRRTRSTKTLLDFLESQRVYSIGRFGAWKYSYMEEAILEGKAAAEKIMGQ